jgi:hypothetical protein
MPGKQEDYRRTEREYRQHAEELFKIAEQTSEQEERERLLRMAEAWLGLAAKMKELSGGRSWRAIAAKLFHDRRIPPRNSGYQDGVLQSKTLELQGVCDAERSPV